MIGRWTSLLGVALICAGCGSLTASPNRAPASVDPRIPSFDTPIAGGTTSGPPIDTSGITRIDIAIVHDASGYPTLHATLADQASIAQFSDDARRRSIGAPPPGADARYACSEGATATYTIDVHQGTGGYQLTEQICNGGLLSGELSGDVRGFLGDIDGFARTE